jgi:hypothetical protein
MFLQRVWVPVEGLLMVGTVCGHVLASLHFALVEKVNQDSRVLIE